MKFIKGYSGNPTGRPKGSKNKKSEQLRDFLADLFNKDRKTLQEYYNGLGAKERFKVFAEFAPYVIPRLSSTELQTQFSNLTDEQLQQIVEQLRKAAIKAA